MDPERNTKKNQFKRPKRLEPKKAKNEKISLKKGL